MKELREAVNHPFQFKNFFVFFTVLYILILTPLLAIESLASTKEICEKDSTKFARTIKGGSGESFEFVYTGEKSCELMIFPVSQDSNLSIWVYKPDNTIQTITTAELSEGIIVSSEDRGSYRVSVHNQGKAEASVSLYVSTPPK